MATACASSSLEGGSVVLVVPSLARDLEERATGDAGTEAAVVLVVARDARSIASL